MPLSPVFGKYSYCRLVLPEKCHLYPTEDWMKNDRGKVKTGGCHSPKGGLSLGNCWVEFPKAPKQRDIDNH